MVDFYGSLRKFSPSLKPIEIKEKTTGSIVKNSTSRSFRFYQFFLRSRAIQVDEKALPRKAVVFAPHPDDETLGCGGTILKKKRAGAKIKVFFMTNGEKSHSFLISEDRLKRIRAREGILACQKMGLEKTDTVFLEYGDQDLTRNMASAIGRVRKILLEEQPDEIFVPCRRELANEDHMITNRIVLFALQSLEKQVTIYEYPVWLYYHVPFVKIPFRNLWELAIILKRSFFSISSLLLNFRCSVYIGGVVDLKRVAMDEHKSQVTRLFPTLQWHTLGDLSGGSFLESFFQKYEFFHQWIFKSELKTYSTDNNANHTT
jgi:LmbE family N-acetylglucosaminyl deacetylase